MGDTIQQLEAEEALEVPFDASDPKQVNEARKKAGRGKKKEREVLAALMSHTDGRTVMFGSIKCVLDGSPLVPGDPYSTYYNLGQEHRARELFKDIAKVCPKEMVLMLEEHWK